MFLTHHHFEQAVPSGLAPQGSRYWRAVEVSLRMPWMVLTVVEEDSEGAFERTLLLSNAADLAGLVGTHKVDSFRGLNLVAHSAVSGDGSGWECRVVRRVWREYGAAGDQHGMFVYEDEGGRMLDEFGTAPSGPAGTRALLLELPSSRPDARTGAKRPSRRTSPE